MYIVYYKTYARQRLVYVYSCCPLCGCYLAVTSSEFGVVLVLWFYVQEYQKTQLAVVVV